MLKSEEIIIGTRSKLQQELIITKLKDGLS